MYTQDQTLEVELIGVCTDILLLWNSNGYAISAVRCSGGGTGKEKKGFHRNTFDFWTVYLFVYGSKIFF